MPTTLQTKFLEDSQGNKYAPVTTPNAVRWPNGDDLGDKLGEKQDKMSIVYIENETITTLSPAIDTFYDIQQNVDTLTITLPIVADTTKVHSIVIVFGTGSSPNVTIDSYDPNAWMLFPENYSIGSNSIYEMVFKEADTGGWILELNKLSWTS